MHNVSEPKYTPSSFTMLPDEAANNQMKKGSKGWSIRDSFCVWWYIYTDQRRESLKGYRQIAWRYTMLTNETFEHTDKLKYQVIGI